MSLIDDLTDLMNFNFDLAFDRFDFIDHSKKFVEIKKLVNKLNNMNSVSDKIIISEKIKIQSKLAKISIEDNLEQIEDQENRLRKNMKQIKNTVSRLHDEYDRMNEYDQQTADNIFSHIDNYLENCIFLLNNMLTEKRILDRFLDILKIQVKNVNMIEERAENKDE